MHPPGSISPPLALCTKKITVLQLGVRIIYVSSCNDYDWPIVIDHCSLWKIKVFTLYYTGFYCTLQVYTELHCTLVYFTVLQSAMLGIFFVTISNIFLHDTGILRSIVFVSRFIGFVYTVLHFTLLHFSRLHRNLLYYTKLWKNKS